MGRTATMLSPTKAAPNYQELSVHKTLRGHCLVVLHPDPLDFPTGRACPSPASAFLTPDSLHLGISSENCLCPIRAALPQHK